MLEKVNKCNKKKLFFIACTSMRSQSAYGTSEVPDECLDLFRMTKSAQADRHTNDPTELILSFISFNAGNL